MPRSMNGNEKKIISLTQILLIILKTKQEVLSIQSRKTQENNYRL